MVALLGDVDTGFGIILLIIFLFFLVRMIFSGGGGNGLSRETRCKEIYKEALKTSFGQWRLEGACKKYYKLSSKEQWQLLMQPELVIPYKIHGMEFDSSEILLLEGMQMAHDKLKNQRAKHIAKLKHNLLK